MLLYCTIILHYTAMPLTFSSQLRETRLASPSARSQVAASSASSASTRLSKHSARSAERTWESGMAR